MISLFASFLQIVKMLMIMCLFGKGNEERTKGGEKD